MARKYGAREHKAHEGPMCLAEEAQSLLPALPSGRGHGAADVVKIHFVRFVLRVGGAA